MKLSAMTKFEQLASSLQSTLSNNISESGFVGDEMILWNRMAHFQFDEEFMEAFNKEARHPTYRAMIYRAHTLVYFLRQIIRKQIPGDCIELGVFRGFKSKILLNCCDSQLEDKKWFLLDTFTGIDEKLASDSPIRNSEHNKPFLIDFIKHRFKKYDRVNIIHGSAPESVAKVTSKNFCFIHLDMNSATAEIASLELLWDSLSPGGCVILDDFGLSSHKAQCLAHKKWFQLRGIHILELPTAQGIVIK